MKNISLKDIEGALRVAFDASEQTNSEEALSRALEWILFEKENILKNIINKLPTPVKHKKAEVSWAGHFYFKGEEDNCSVIYYSFKDIDTKMNIVNEEQRLSFYEMKALPKNIYICIELLDEGVINKAYSWQEFDRIISTYFKRNNYILIS